jgi:hypothetical protein
LAAQTTDLLGGQGAGAALAGQVSGPVTAATTAEGVLITAKDPEASSLRFTIPGAPAKGSELFLSVEMKGHPLSGYPREMARFARVGVSGGMVNLMAEEPLEIGVKLRGAPEETPLDRAQGAMFQDRPRTIGGQTLATFFVHPPYQGGTGYTFWTQEADVPDDGELRFSIAMGEKSPRLSDGVSFQVYVADRSGGAVGQYRRVFEATTNQHQWLPQVVSLAPLAGKRVRLKFVADCGPNDHTVTDHAHWGDVKIVRAGAKDEDITKSQQYMTWVNDRFFQSGFFYRRIRSKTVDVSFAIEGSEPVVLRSLTAHAHPDAMYRVFEGGIVLANPSLQPYAFDLEKLSPGRSYRRIQAVPTQDVQTNNGSPAGPAVTLPGRDALFLIRTTSASVLRRS